MIEEKKLNNLKLSFSWEMMKKEVTGSVGDYFKDFPFENYDLNKISTTSNELSYLIDKLELYFQSHTLKRFESQDNVIWTGHNNPKICFDKEREIQIKDGFIPVCLSFCDPHISECKGYFCWEI